MIKKHIPKIGDIYKSQHGGLYIVISFNQAKLTNKNITSGIKRENCVYWKRSKFKNKGDYVGFDYIHTVTDGKSYTFIKNIFKEINYKFLIS